MKPEIKIEIKGIHGVLRYSYGTEHYEIPIEHTGDYSQGFLVFVRELEKQLKVPDPMKRKSEILRELQRWAKENNQRLCW